MFLNIHVTVHVFVSEWMGLLLSLKGRVFGFLLFGGISGSKLGLESMLNILGH